MVFQPTKTGGSSWISAFIGLSGLKKILGQPTQSFLGFPLLLVRGIVFTITYKVVPPSYKLVYNPINYSYITINHSYWNYKPT